MKRVLIALLSEDYFYSLVLFSSIVPIPSIHLTRMYSLTDLQPASLAFLLNSSTSASVTRRRITVERTVDGSGVFVLIDFGLLLGIRNFRFFQIKNLDDSDQTVRSYRSPTLQSQNSLSQKDRITGEQMNNLIFIHTTIIRYASGSDVLAHSFAS